MPAVFTQMSDGLLVRIADGSSIPPVVGNRDYDEALELIAAGAEVEPPIAPPATPTTFVARDLIDQLTEADLVAIESAVEASTALRLLWVRLRARGDKPIDVSADAFLQGWAGLTDALGETRAADLASALGIA